MPSPCFIWGMTELAPQQPLYLMNLGSNLLQDDQLEHRLLRIAAVSQTCANCQSKP
jgi:hypothetical protein